MSMIDDSPVYETKDCLQNPNDPEAAEKFQEMAAAFVPSLVIIVFDIHLIFR